MHRFNEPTRTYGGGRFVVDIPAAMTFAGGYSMRTFALKETVWDTNHAQEQPKNLWNETIAEIQKLPPPEGIPNALLETKQIDDIGNGLRFAFSHKDELRPKRGYLDALLITDTTGLWITGFGKATGKDFMYRKSTDIARAYRAPEKRFDRVDVMEGRDAFYLRYGAVDLPFEYKESVDIVFRKYPLDKQLVLTINTRVVDKVNPVGMLEGLAVALAANIAPGVEVEKIRTRKRTVAGLVGEEMILKATERGKTMLNFQWYYPGQVNDSLHPRMLLIMDANSDALEDKIDLWDAILDSLRPAGR